jgi:hypothetical protein
MVIKDHRWIGLVGGDTLFSTPSISYSMTMTLMYICFKVHIINALS